jgi:hypothetical protein
VLAVARSFRLRQKSRITFFEHGKVVRGRLCVSIQEVSADFARAIDLPDSSRRAASG